MGRMIAIGDIHGYLEPLQQLMAQLALSSSDHVVFLGDYIDRGDQSAQVIEYLIAFGKQHPQTTFLRGNHEQMLLWCLDVPEYLDYWCKYGGAQTLQSYGLPCIAASLHQLPSSHLAWLNQTSYFLETDEYLLVHGLPQAERPLDEQSPDDYLWQHFQQQADHQSGKVVICGHTPQDQFPIQHGRSICIDTGIYRGGWLTALDVNNRQYLQVNVEQQIRLGGLG
jgi:serine/threonine protein phosphatase 1